MNSFRKLYIALGALGALCFSMLEAASKNPPVVSMSIPNVIIIYTDDHGVTDLGIHGYDSNVDTPTLDRLAAGGALMNAGYASAPKCVPSRAGVMTGRIQNEIGVVTNEDDPLPLTAPSGCLFSPFWPLFLIRFLQERNTTASIDLDGTLTTKFLQWAGTIILGLVVLLAINAQL